MFHLLDINTIFFTIMGYPMSYIEFFGTVLNIWSVWLTAKNKVLSWPIGILGVILYIFLFYQIQLYSDFVEQLYFLITGFYGWYIWTHPKDTEQDTQKELRITLLSQRETLYWLRIIVICTFIMTVVMQNIHLLFPTLFTEAASFPFLDAFTTVLSFVATLLMVRKKIECWYLWILVDIIGIYLYFIKDVKFIALEYVIFLILATKGLISWQREYIRRI